MAGITANTSRPQFFRWFCAFAAALMAIAPAAQSSAHTSHDGMWRVTIITQSGNCDPVYSYPVKVSGGQVSYSGGGSFEISGNVGESGNVSVSIALGKQRAAAHGKLNGHTGSGQWSGKSSGAACSGRWEAMRNS
jgi:hypothetical protein